MALLSLPSLATYALYASFLIHLGRKEKAANVEVFQEALNLGHQGKIFQTLAAIENTLDQPG